MTLEQELQKPIYAGMTHQEKLAALHGVQEAAIGHIRYGDTLHLVSMLARGLRARIESCQIAELKAAFAEALHPSYLASPAYSINVGLPEIKGMLDMGLNAGVVTAAEHAFIIQLATYQRKPWQSVTLHDVIAVVEPALLNVGEWQEFEASHHRRLVINSQSHVTANPTMHVQVKESHNGADWTEWRDFMRVAVPVGVSYQPIIQSNLQRKFRWRGAEYKLNATVEAI